MQRVWYFGTEGCPGHYPKGINCKLTEAQCDTLNRTDGEHWIAMIFNPLNNVGGTRFYYKQGLFVDAVVWSIIAIPYSVDDKRGGSHTELFWEGEHSAEEMIEMIRNNAFLSRQFDL